jgi:hypothetical protein
MPEQPQQKQTRAADVEDAQPLPISGYIAVGFMGFLALMMLMILQSGGSSLLS